jgi:LPXTG-motif cell wall-anchored protein
MRRLAQVLAAAALVAGGLTLTGGAAEAAACSGTSGVTVVIDFGSSTSTRCAPESSTAIAALKSVAAVTPVPMYGDGVVCKIDGIPESQTCQRMPPASAYWAFFHAPRGGSWTYSSNGVASYDPPSGSVIGFAFGSGGAPSTPPPAAAASTPKPSPKPSPSSTSSKPRATSTSTSTAARPRATTPAPARSSVTVLPNGATTTVPATRGGPTTTRPAEASTTATVPPNGTNTTDSGELARAATASSEPTGTGSPTTLLAGAGLVALVGAAAAYLAVRRRRAQH